MLKKYNQLSKKVENKKKIEEINLDVVNKFSRQLINHVFTVEEIISICKKIASGKITEIDDYKLFDNLLKNNPRIKKDLNKLLKLIICCCSNYDFVIYKNAYLQYNFINSYKNFLEKENDINLRQCLSQKINPGNKKGNVSYYLYNSYNSYMNDILNPNRNYKLSGVDFYINYCNSYFGGCNKLLLILKNIQNKNIEIENISSNEIYNLTFSFVNLIEKQIENNNYENFSIFTELYMQIKNNNFETLNNKVSHIYNLGINKKTLVVIKKYLKEEDSINKICNHLGMKKEKVLIEVKKINEELYNELYKLIKQEEDKQNRKNKEEWEEFITNMNKVMNNFEPSSFKPIYYYSLTSINIKDMIVKLGNNGQIKIMNYLNTAYFNNQELYEKVSMNIYNEKISDRVIRLVATKIKEENIPKCRGIIDELISQYRNNTLDEFSVKNIKNLILNEEKRK